jgi:hypothetical protein
MLKRRFRRKTDELRKDWSRFLNRNYVACSYHKILVLLCNKVKKVKTDMCVARKGF